VTPVQLRHGLVSLGGLVAAALVGSWTLSFGACLALGAQDLTGVGWVGLVLGRTLLHTGLFATAHDAMHGWVCPDRPKLNRAIGQLCLRLYAGLSYEHCRVQHLKHHARPGQTGDPDFHDGERPQIWVWYLRFMSSYLDVHQWWVTLSGVALLGVGLVWGLGVPWLNLLWFWWLPMGLSSLQLFLFGTYLPHREPLGGHTNGHRAQSLAYPWLLSLVSCYHFGYHWEHHEYPQEPWYNLPRLRPVTAHDLPIVYPD
jgi:beta-carotene/zeaxanthin 4-ketolase